LSERIAVINDDCFVLGVDILFRALLRQGIINRFRPNVKTVQHFLCRQRFQDDERKISQNALDYTSLDIATLASSNLIAGNEHPIRAYGNVIDEMTEMAGRTAWVAFDLHPEFIYSRLRALIPGLKLVAVYRDPAEAIAATLYRKTPRRNPRHTRREFRRAFLLWGISAVTITKQCNKWPNDVSVLTFPELHAGSNDQTVFGIKVHTQKNSAIAHDRLHFHQTNGGFRLPNGELRSLLSSQELTEIRLLLGPLASAVGLKSDNVVPHKRASLSFELYFRAVMFLAEYAPQKAASAIDFFDNPLGVLHRHTSHIHQALKYFLHQYLATKRNL